MRHYNKQNYARCRMQNLFLGLYSKQLHIKNSRKLRLSILRDKGQHFFRFKHCISN